MKVFFDTNVLVSAFAARGLCADLLRRVLAEHQLVVGEVVLVELRRALRDKIRLPADTVKDIETLLRQGIVEPRPKHHLKLALRDKDDEWIVASAVAAHADVLVTGDKDLLQATKTPVPIVEPRGLWEMLRGSSP